MTTIYTYVIMQASIQVYSREQRAKRTYLYVF